MTSSPWRFGTMLALFGFASVLLPAAVGAQCPIYLTQWGAAAPAGVAADAASNVYVSDYAHYRVRKFTGTGTFLTEWGSMGTGEGQFGEAGGPGSLAVSSTGDVYVVDSRNFRIEKFTGTGTFLTEWGSVGTGDGQFLSPSGVAVDAAGDVYVVDYSSNRLQKFTSTGAYLTQWGSPGSGNGQFNGPAAVATDGAGNIYVADYVRIQKFTSAGTFLTQWGSIGTGNGQFLDIYGVTTDAAGSVYVVDPGVSRIQRFTNSGAYQCQWGAGVGSGDGQFNFPNAIATDAARNVFVADGGNVRIQKFGVQDAELEVAVDLDPNTINLKSHAPWLTAYIEPLGFDPASIDISTLRLSGSVPAVSKPAIIGDHNKNGAPDLMVKFSREALDPLLTLGVNQLEVAGTLVTGRQFKGSGSVQVIDPPREPLSASVTPNPLNPVGVLTFHTTRPGSVSIKVFDLHGRLVRTLIDARPLAVGSHDVLFDGLGDGGQHLSSGVYFYRVDAPDGTVMGRLAVLK